MRRQRSAAGGCGRYDWHNVGAFQSDTLITIDLSDGLTSRQAPLERDACDRTIAALRLAVRGQRRSLEQLRSASFAALAKAPSGAPTKVRDASDGMTGVATLNGSILSELHTSLHVAAGECPWGGKVRRASKCNGRCYCRRTRRRGWVRRVAIGRRLYTSRVSMSPHVQSACAGNR